MRPDNVQFNPDEIKENARAAVFDAGLKCALKNSTVLACKNREIAMGSFPEYDDLRIRANLIKERCIKDNENLVSAFVRTFTSNGGRVHIAENSEAACKIVTEVIKKKGINLAVKSKSMVTEEIGLNQSLLKAGIEVIETDIGEYIVQLMKEPPSHLTAPAIHRTRSEVGALFSKEFGISYTENIGELTLIARNKLREKFLTAGAGLSGANFLIAETGTVAIVENEGNARFVTTLPGLHIVITGIEKVIGKFSELAVFLELLARSATGQIMTSYLSLINRPEQLNETCGPKEVHVILVDNGRKKLMQDEKCSQILYCIRCGACQNICPVYRSIGGHAYGHVYQGPLGSALVPSLFSVGGNHLPFASTLCGACNEVCPVKINLTGIILHLRNRSKKSFPSKMAAFAAAKIMLHPKIFRIFLFFAEKLSGLFSRIYMKIIRIIGWGPEREPISPAKRSFRDIYGDL